MAEYVIILSKSAQKQLDKLNESVAAPLLKAIAALAVNPRPYGHKKLKGREGYRIRSGNYRILYDIVDKKLIMEVVAVGNRRDIYD